MQKTPGLANETPKTQVERPGPVFIIMTALVALIALCIFGSFIYFFAKNVPDGVYRPVPTATSTLDPTSAVLATNAAASTTPQASPTRAGGIAPTVTAPAPAGGTAVGDPARCTHWGD